MKLSIQVIEICGIVGIEAAKLNEATVPPVQRLSCEDVFHIAPADLLIPDAPPQLVPMTLPVRIASYQSELIYEYVFICFACPYTGYE